MSIAMLGAPVLGQTVETAKPYLGDPSKLYLTKTPELHLTEPGSEQSPEESAQGADWGLLGDWSAFTGVEGSALGVGSVAIKNSVAKRGRYARTGFSLEGLSFGARFVRIIVANFAIGMFVIDDLAPFMQSVTDGERLYTGESSVSAVWLSASLGLSTPPLAYEFLTLHGGLNLGAELAQPSRTIDNCVDCRIDTIDSFDGYYVEPNVVLAVRTSRTPNNIVLGLRAAYRYFFGGSDLLRQWAIGLTIGFYPNPDP
jgi:hypothetical protein